MTMRFTGSARIIVLVLASVAVVLAVAGWLLQRVVLPAKVKERLTITASWPGAEVAQLERSVTEPLERAVAVEPDVSRVRSVTRDGVATVTIERTVEEVGDVRGVFTAVQRAQSQLPDGVYPTVTRREADLKQERFVVRSSSWPLADVSKWASKELRLSFATQPGVRDVELCGAVDERVVVKVDPQRLAAYGLGVAQLANVEPTRDLDALGETPLGEARLKDVATIELASAPGDCVARFDGAPVVVVTVLHRADALKVAEPPAGVTVTRFEAEEGALYVAQDDVELPGLTLRRDGQVQTFGELPTASLPLVRGADGVVVQVFGADRDALASVAEALRAAVEASSPRWLGVVQPARRPQRTLEVSARERRSEVAALVRLYLAGQHGASFADGAALELRLVGPLDQALLADGTPLSSVVRWVDTLVPDALLREASQPVVQFEAGATGQEVRRATSNVVLPAGVMVVVNRRD